MKTYVLDVLENILTEEEANQYYYKAFIEMNKREKIPYIVNENRYLKFLLRLYKMDKNVVYKCRFFENENKIDSLVPRLNKREKIPYIVNENRYLR